MSRFRFTTVLTVLVLAAVAAFAQGTTTSNLTGSVTTDGAPLPGVLVTITSPNLQGTRTAITNEAGTYNFPGIPPGQYTVLFELDGMQPITRRVDVGVAQTGRANANMRLSALAEAITVTAAAPSVLETTQVSTNISHELLDNLPIARTINQAALLAPGVNANTFSANQFSISGSPGYDNLVMVNGVVVTESVRSQLIPLYVEDAVQETTVLTGAISAEYGRFTGGVVNSITKSGGNQFSGSLRNSLSNPAWTSLTPWPNQAEPSDDLNQVYEGTLGGFILRDRLWFFTAGRYAETSLELFGRPVPGDASNTIYNVLSTNESRRLEGKLTANFLDRHSLVGSFFDEQQESTNQRFTAATYDLDSLNDRSDPRQLFSGFYNGVITQNLLVEGRYSAMDYGIGHGSGSRFTDPIRGTLMLNLGDAQARFNSPTFCGVCDEEWRNNEAWGLKGNYFLSTGGMGTHNITAGVEDFSEMRYANNHQSGSGFRIFVNSVQRIGDQLYPTINPGMSAPAALIRWTPIFESARYSDMASRGIFINDSWDVTQRLSVNLGARYDENNAVDASGNLVSDDAKFSPRLGLSFDVAGNGRHRVSASYSEYVTYVTEGPGTASSAAGAPAAIDFAYMGPAINPAGTPANELLNTHQALELLFNWFNSQGGTSNLDLLRTGGARSVPGFSSAIADTLVSPSVRELALGYGVQLGRGAFAKVDFIDRDWRDFFAYRVDASTPQSEDFLGIGRDVSIVENTNDIVRKYRGIQFQSQWRPEFVRRLGMGLNYTWSELTGNDTQENAASGNIGNTPGSIYYPELLDYARREPIGFLGQDQTHRAKVWASYDIPIGFLGNVNLSALHNYDSGLPYSVSGTVVVAGAGTGSPTGLTYINAPTTGAYFFSERGALRLPDTHRTDLALNYSLPIRGLNLFAQAEMLNIFDRSDLVTVNTVVNSAAQSAAFARFDPRTTPVESLIECPQGTALAQCQAMGAHYQKGVNFGNPTGPAAYQLARTYRFNVGVRF
jgi:hypothetical protein